MNSAPPPSFPAAAGNQALPLSLCNQLRRGLLHCPLLPRWRRPLSRQAQQQIWLALDDTQRAELIAEWRRGLPAGPAPITQPALANEPWAETVALRRLPRQPQAALLQSVGRNRYRREQFLAPQAARAMQRLLAAARAQGLQLEVVSSFRSIAHQRRIVERKHAAGQSWQDILRISAAPGYSEHHSGRAADLALAGEPVLTEAFAATDAYQWLCEHAGDYGFRLSYPPGNQQGYLYEPWHWYYRGR